MEAGQETLALGCTGRADILVAGEETGGRLALVATAVALGGEPPRHVHHWEDETLYVLEGALRVWLAGAWVEASAGAAVFVPRGVEHGFAVASAGARVLTALSPAGFEGFYRELGAAPDGVDLERLVGTAARFGCEITGPPPRPALPAR